MKEREKIVAGYKAVKVTLNDISLNVAKSFWDAYKMTWVQLQDVEYDHTNPEIRQACINVVNNFALPTPKESVKFNFRIENISRVCLAQITRGRVGWWYNVESQMPQLLNHGVTVPLNVAESKYGTAVSRLIAESQELYDKLADEGFPPQDLRYLCMHGQQTSMVADCNFAALPGFFAMRCENGLTDELNLVARQMLLEIKLKIEEAKEQNQIDDLDYEVWQLMISKLDCLGANAGKCLIYDKVFGNTGRFPSGHDKVASPGGLIKPDYDFRKSAWYKELCEMDEALLFKGEKEMIARWKEGGPLVEGEDDTQADN